MDRFVGPAQVASWQAFLLVVIKSMIEGFRSVDNIAHRFFRADLGGDVYRWVPEGADSFLTKELQTLRDAWDHEQVIRVLTILMRAVCGDILSPFEIDLVKGHFMWAHAASFVKARARIVRLGAYTKGDRAIYLVGWRGTNHMIGIRTIRDTTQLGLREVKRAHDECRLNGYELYTHSILEGLSHDWAQEVTHHLEEAGYIVEIRRLGCCVYRSS